jgi:copper chaperone NosL
MNRYRIIFLIGVLMLGGLYFFPVWKISLGVPQYPKEISIHIWISGIENGTKKAMEIMNVLNHNIGMKEIDPEAIPELKWFPWILGGILILGVASSFPGNKNFRLVFLIFTLILLCLAMVDFYLWEYEYGHNLAEDAPIQIEGGSFQPPLIGQKNIVNFMVKSYPMIGSLFPVTSVVTMMLAIRKEK